jgi:hypothetical protein
MSPLTHKRKLQKHNQFANPEFHNINADFA